MEPNLNLTSIFVNLTQAQTFLTQSHRCDNVTEVCAWFCQIVNIYLKVVPIIVILSNDLHFSKQCLFIQVT